MKWRNTKYNYGVVAKSFHWLIFLLIAFMLMLGFWMTSMENTPLKFQRFGLHKELGFCILVLVGLRLMWKIISPPPLLPDALGKWEKFMAHAGHAVLYVLIIAMPLSGWAMSSAGGLQVSVFGWFLLPNLVAPDNTLKHQLADVHSFLAWTLIVMVTLHILAALLHHFYYKDNVLKRMTPFVHVPEE